jgi:Domain of unknown function (DUF4149)
LTDVMRERWMHLLMALWLGNMCTICFIVAPAMFHLLPDRHLAGTVAGFFFSTATALGLILGCVVLVILLRATTRTKANLTLVLIAMTAPLLSELALRPLMQAARDAGNLSRFGLLHAASGLLFLVACISLLILVWRLPATQTR